MTLDYVFDTEAIIAFLYDEPGNEYIRKLLTEIDGGDSTGALAETNASEVFYLVARFEGTSADEPTPDSLRAADRDLRALARHGLSIERADWQTAGEIKADGHVSLADAYGVALAHEQDATLVAGGDDDIETLPVAVEIEQFRNHGV